MRTKMRRRRETRLVVAAAIVRFWFGFVGALAVGAALVVAVGVVADLAL